MNADVAIVGGGFAGAATAYHLTRGGRELNVVLFDREEVPGVHSSGRNASLVRQPEARSRIRRLAAASVAAYAERAEELGFAQVGSLLLGGPAELQALRDPSLFVSAVWSAAEATARVPLLEGHDFEAALWTPGDGIMDIARLLQFYLDGARAEGCEVRLGCPVEIIRQRGEGWELGTAEGTWAARVVVNAAGAWANQLARTAGVTPRPMTAYKRHLFVLDGVEPLDPAWPFVWDVADGFYFRPESGGLLFCICDETPYEDDFEPRVEPDIYDRMAEKVDRCLPRLREATVRRVWAGFRVKTPDDEFHLGPSPEAPGFFWVAGLGGHGMGCSWEIGRTAAELILETYF
ncbi:MAG: FAD-binding oxidoreductase [Acidobacteriota bacterium]